MSHPPPGNLSTARRSASRVGQIFSFPDPVNEVSARLVAGGVFVITFVTVDWRWLTAGLAYGFVARVLSGPSLSPLGQFVTRVLTPRLPIAVHPVAGPPKRFAQGMGAVISITALALTALGYWSTAQIVLVLLMTAAFLECAFGFCLGCKTFAVVTRSGILPASVCERCNDVGSAVSRSN